MIDGQKRADIDEEQNSIAKGHKNVADEVSKVQKGQIDNSN